MRYAIGGGLGALAVVALMLLCINLAVWIAA